MLSFQFDAVTAKNVQSEKDDSSSNHIERSVENVSADKPTIKPKDSNNDPATGSEPVEQVDLTQDPPHTVEVASSSPITQEVPEVAPAVEQRILSSGSRDGECRITHQDGQILGELCMLYATDRLYIVQLVDK